MLSLIIDTTTERGLIAFAKDFEVIKDIDEIHDGIYNIKINGKIKKIKLILIIMKLIIGLGNFGKEYEKTRHNFGQIVLNEWLKKKSAQFLGQKFA